MNVFLRWGYVVDKGGCFWFDAQYFPAIDCDHYHSIAGPGFPGYSHHSVANGPAFRLS